MGSGDINIRVVCGPMFAGKTTELIRSVRGAIDSPDKIYQHILIIKPATDTRGVCGQASTDLPPVHIPPAMIATHNGDTLKDCHINPLAACGKVSERVIVSSVTSAESIIGVLSECVSGLGPSKRMFLGIDEVQFFAPEWISEVFGWCTGISGRIDIVAVGLDMDRNGDIFPGMGEVLGLCQARGITPERLMGICSVCGQRNATHTFYRGGIVSDSQVLVGGADLYEPRCYLHWLSGGVEAFIGR